MTNEDLNSLTRPIIGLTRCTPNEVYAIMCDRIRFAFDKRQQRPEGTLEEGQKDGVVTDDLSADAKAHMAEIDQAMRQGVLAGSMLVGSAQTGAESHEETPEELRKSRDLWRGIAKTEAKWRGQAEQRVKAALRALKPFADLPIQNAPNCEGYGQYLVSHAAIEAAKKAIETKAEAASTSPVEQAPVVRIKALNWRQSRAKPVTHEAITNIGVYRIESEGGNLWVIILNGLPVQRVTGTVTHAMTAAQALHDARVKSEIVVDETKKAEVEHHNV